MKQGLAEKASSFANCISLLGQDTRHYFARESNEQDQVPETLHYMADKTVQSG